MRFLFFLLRVFGPRWNISPAIAEYFAAAGRLGCNDAIPTQLIPLGARLWARGWLNKKFFDTHRDWILPYWAVHQLDPKDPAFVARGLQPVLLNSTHRNWIAIGSLGNPCEGIVDPRGLVTPRPNEDDWSLDTWVCVGDNLYAPSRMDTSAIEQNLFENLPIVQTRYGADGLRVTQEIFGVQDNWIVAAVTVENSRDEPRTAMVYLSVRPFNPEGVSLIKQIEFRENAFWVNGALGGFIPLPDAVGTSDERAGDVAFQILNLNNVSCVQCDVGMATAVAEYHLELPPHSSCVITTVMPMTNTCDVNADAARWIAPDEFARLRREVITQWREVLARGMCIRVPDERLQQAFDANKAYLLLLHDGDSITPGPFTYHQFWFRDAAYMLNALGQLGYHTQVKQVLKTYRRRLQKDGYFLAQDGEWDANGQALWSMTQDARRSGDFELLAAEYWQMLNAAHWIDAQRQQTKKDGRTAPHYGLLPAGMSAEHLGPNDYFYWDDFWGLAGLQSTELAARFFNKKEDAQKLRVAFDAFRQDVDASLAKVATRNGATWMPASPYRRTDSAMVANLAALYPLQLFASDDPCIKATLAELERVARVEDAFFHHVGHAGFGTYLSLHLAGCYLFQRRAEAWPIIQWALKHASPTFTWAEAIHPLTRHGGMGDGHHGWAAADWISIVRNALLFEEDTHFVLTPALPLDWTRETMSLQVENAATYFGDVNYTIAFGERTATLMIQANWREPPEYIEWNLPFVLKNAGGDRAGVEIVNNRVQMPNDVRKVVVMW